CISRFLPYLKRYFRFLSVGSVGKALNFFRMIFSSSFILSSSLRRSNSSRSVSFRGSLFDTCFWLFFFFFFCFIFFLFFFFYFVDSTFCLFLFIIWFFLYYIYVLLVLLVCSLEHLYYLLGSCDSS